MASQLTNEFELYSALSEASMNKIALLINVAADDWTAERAIILVSTKICFETTVGQNVLKH